MRKVVDRWYANVGGYADRDKRREIENTCDAIMLEIFSSPSILEMLNKHTHYMGVVSDNYIDAIKYVNKLERYFHSMGFGYIDIFYKIQELFSCPSDNESVLSNLTSMIGEAIKINEPQLPIADYITVENSSGKGEIGKLQMEFVFHFDYQYGICTMTD